MSRRIIVTGANGFVGQQLVKQMKKAGWEVLPLVRRPAGLTGELVVDFDIPGSCATLEGLPPCQAIIHLATHVDFSNEAKMGDFFGTNILATSLLCDLARRWCAHFVFASGTIVYAHSPQVDTTTTVSPEIPYAKAKCLAEQIIASAVERHTILRIGGIFGYGGPDHLGLNRAIRGALDSGEVPELYGDGAGRRNYIYVEDLANCVVEILKQGIEGTHLVAGNEQLTIAEMLQQLCDILLPGTSPVQRIGSSSVDSVVEPSPMLPQGRTFESALKSIKETYERHGV